MASLGMECRARTRDEQCSVGSVRKRPGARLILSPIGQQRERFRYQRYGRGLQSKSRMRPEKQFGRSKVGLFERRRMGVRVSLLGLDYFTHNFGWVPGGDGMEVSALREFQDHK